MTDLQGGCEHAAVFGELGQTLEEACRLLEAKSAPAVGVVDAGGKLVGLITPETIGEMLLVRDARPGRFRAGPWGSRPAGA